MKSWQINIKKIFVLQVKINNGVFYVFFNSWMLTIPCICVKMSSPANCIWKRARESRFELLCIYYYAQKDNFLSFHILIAADVMVNRRRVQDRSSLALRSTQCAVRLFILINTFKKSMLFCCYFVVFKWFLQQNNSELL